MLYGKFHSVPNRCLTKVVTVIVFKHYIMIRPVDKKLAHKSSLLTQLKDHFGLELSHSASLKCIMNSSANFGMVGESAII